MSAIADDDPIPAMATGSIAPAIATLADNDPNTVDVDAIIASSNPISAFIDSSSAHAVIAIAQNDLSATINCLCNSATPVLSTIADNDPISATDTGSIAPAIATIADDDPVSALTSGLIAPAIETIADDDPSTAADPNTADIFPYTTSIPTPGYSSSSRSNDSPSSAPRSHESPSSAPGSHESPSSSPSSSPPSTHGERIWILCRFLTKSMANLWILFKLLTLQALCFHGAIASVIVYLSQVKGSLLNPANPISDYWGHANVWSTPQPLPLSDWGETASLLINGEEEILSFAGLIPGLGE